MSTHRAVAAVPVLLLLALTTVSGCSGGSDKTGSSAPVAERTSESEVAPGDKTGSTLSSRTDSAGTGAGTGKAAVTPLSRDVISTGQISLRATSLGKARAEVVRLVTSWKGVVSDEQTDSDGKGRVSESTMTLRVPSPMFSTAMDALARVATVRHRSRTSEDVTTEVIDNDARVRAAERSIRQIEALLGRAKALSDVIAIEADLARRQADLDSLKSQQAWLSDQTSLSTITVNLSRTQSARKEHEARGFLAGLSDGWSALGSATVGLLTVAGAVLPFAVLVALLGVPLWWVVRRRAAAVSAASAPARSA